MDDSEFTRLIGGPVRLTLDEITSHPRIPDARKLYLDRFLQLYGGDPFLVRLLIETGRVLVYLTAVVLEAAQDPARRETWFTVGRLKQQMAMYGLASARHIDELIARLCAVGYMEFRPSEQDRRVRILSPTEKLRAHDRDWLAAHYAPLTVLYPHHDYELVMQRDPAFQAVHRRTAIAFLPPAALHYASLADMLLIMNWAAGYMVIATLLQSAMDDPDNPGIAVPFADVGDRFGVSRTHVRKLLVAAAESGLVKLHTRGGHRVEILPRLWASHDRSIAVGMYFHDMTYLAAVRAQRLASRGASAALQQVQANYFK